MKSWVLRTGVGYAGRQARRQSAIIKYFFHCMFRKDGVKEGSNPLFHVGKRVASHGQGRFKTGNQRIAHFRFSKQWERRWKSVRGGSKSRIGINNSNQYERVKS